MHALNISWVDLAVAGVVVLSTVLAVVRGFIRETLSIFSWAAAAFAALYCGPAAAALLRPHISTPLLGALIGYAGVFLVVLIPLSFVSWRLSERVRRSPIGTLDRSLGVPFGILRGLALVGIAYLAVSLVVPVREQPSWITGSRLFPLVQGSSDVLLSLIPEHHRDVVDTTGTKSATAASVSGQQVAHAAARTYSADDRRALDRLIEETGASGSGKQ
jgi:membrane protein required for colicin V production